MGVYILCWFVWACLYSVWVCMGVSIYCVGLYWRVYIVCGSVWVCRYLISPSRPVSKSHVPFCTRVYSHGLRRSDLKSLRLPKFPTSFHGSPCTYQTRFRANGVPVTSEQSTHHSKDLPRFFWRSEDPNISSLISSMSGSCPWTWIYLDMTHTHTLWTWVYIVCPLCLYFMSPSWHVPKCNVHCVYISCPFWTWVYIMSLDTSPSENASYGPITSYGPIIMDMCLYLMSLLDMSLYYVPRHESIWTCVYIYMFIYTYVRHVLCMCA